MDAGRFKSVIQKTFIRPCLSLCAPVMIVILIMLAVFGCGSEEEVSIPGSQVTFSAATPLLNMRNRLKALTREVLVTKPATDFFVNVQAEQAVGHIEIPRLGVRERIVEGTSDAALALGAGHQPGTSVPGMGGNFAIAGDRVLYSAPLLRVNTMQIGDEVLVNMPYADFIYLVETIEVVDPSNVSVLQSKGYESMTMITCDPQWQLSTRMVISAKLINTIPKV